MPLPLGALLCCPLVEFPLLLACPFPEPLSCHLGAVYPMSVFVGVWGGEGLSLVLLGSPRAPPLSPTL